MYRSAILTVFALFGAALAVDPTPLVVTAIAYDPATLTSEEGNVYAREICKGIPVGTSKCITDVSYVICNGGTEQQQFVMQGAHCEQGIVCQKSDSIVFGSASTIRKFANSPLCTASGISVTTTSMVTSALPSGTPVTPTSIATSAPAGSGPVDTTSVYASALAKVSSIAYAAMASDLAIFAASNSDPAAVASRASAGSSIASSALASAASVLSQAANSGAGTTAAPSASAFATASTKLA